MEPEFYLPPNYQLPEMQSLSDDDQPRSTSSSWFSESSIRFGSLPSRYPSPPSFALPQTAPPLRSTPRQNPNFDMLIVSLLAERYPVIFQELVNEVQQGQGYQEEYY